MDTDESTLTGSRVCKSLVPCFRITRPLLIFLRNFFIFITLRYHVLILKSILRYVVNNYVKYINLLIYYVFKNLQLKLQSVIIVVSSIFNMIICLPSQMIPKIIHWFNIPKYWYLYIQKSQEIEFVSFYIAFNLILYIHIIKHTVIQILSNVNC